MNHGHFPHINFFGTNDHRVGEYGAFSSTPTTMINTQSTYLRDSTQAQAPAQSTIIHPSEHVSRVAGDTLGVYRQAFEDGGYLGYSVRGVTHCPFSVLPFVDVACIRDPHYFLSLPR